MDRAKELVRTVTRGFYEAEHIIAIDALVNHVALTTEDFRIIFANTGRQNKDILKFLAKLKDGGLLASFARPEIKPGAQKPTTVEYYYIDYRRAVDATKYRLHVLEDKLNKSQKASEKAKRDYICPRCKSEYNELDVIDAFDMAAGGFLCKKCSHLLQWQDHEADEPGKGTGSDSTIGIFNKQLGRIVKLLKQIDEAFIPLIAPETAIAEARPVPRNVEPHDFPRNDPMETRVVRPTAVKGMNTGPEKVEVSISTNADNVAAAAAAEAERKRKKEANAVPEWYTHSTVTNEITAIGAREAAAKRELNDGLGPAAATDADEKKVVEGDASLEAFYAALEEEKAQERAREAARAEEDDEGSEEEFEDVVDGGLNGIGEPLAKRLKVDSETGSQAATPADIAGTQDSEDEDDFEDA